MRTTAAIIAACVLCGCAGRDQEHVTALRTLTPVFALEGKNPPPEAEALRELQPNFSDELSAKIAQELQRAQRNEPGTQDAGDAALIQLLRNANGSQ